MTLGYFFMNGGVLKFGTVSLAADVTPAIVVKRRPMKHMLVR